MIKNIFLIGVGGAIGSILRYLTSFFIIKHAATIFPWATFIVNIVGCLIIGLLFGVFEKQQLGQEWRFLFITGFCGGYTTFSAFAFENIQLLQTGNSLIALLYICGSVLIGVLAVWFGIMVVR